MEGLIILLVLIAVAAAVGWFWWSRRSPRIIAIDTEATNARGTDDGTDREEASR